MLGYVTAKHTLELGRGAFLGSPEADLPPSSSAIIRGDDLTPQFGYVGPRYNEARVLLFGINPGNGRRDSRSDGDEQMLPELIRFREDRTEESFRRASMAYFEVCQHWPVWQPLCSEFIGDGKLSLDQMAYSNCLPWRTASGTQFSEETAERAARLYALPLVEEVEPKIVIALYKRAANILEMHGRPLELIRWNGAQAPTEAVKSERESTAETILRRVGL